MSASCPRCLHIQPMSPQITPNKKQKKQKSSGRIHPWLCLKTHPGIFCRFSRLSSQSRSGYNRHAKQRKVTTPPTLMPITWSWFSFQIYHTPSSGSQSKIPSKLRDSSTAPFIEKSSTPGSSRSSSPEVVSAATPSSTFSMHSPAFNGRVGNGKKTKGKVAGVGPPKRLSPPRPPPPPVQDYTIGELELQIIRIVLTTIKQQT